MPGRSKTAKKTKDSAPPGRVYRSAFRAAKDGIILVDAKTGSIEDGNPSLLKMLGLTKNGLLKKKIWDIGFLVGPLSDKTAFAQLKRKKRTDFGQLPIRTGRGKRLDADLGCAFYGGGDHDVVQFNLRDVTERERLRIALEEHEAQYHSIFDNSRLGIAIISSDFRITKINRAFSRITGYNESDVLRLSLADITHPSHIATNRKIMRVAWRGAAGEFHVEKRYIGKQGNVIWANTYISTVRGKDGRPLYLQAFIEDITERKLIEAELAEQNLRNIEKERMIQKLKDEFIFIAAHELRTPVTAIGWAMELLKESRMKTDARAEGQTEAMDILGENVKRLNNLVFELLEVSRIEYGTYKVDLEKCEIGDIIGRAVAALRPMAEERSIHVEVESVPDDFPAAFADPVRVYEILTNLLTNAIKYNKDGGSVIVRAKEGVEELHVSVEDTGFGLSAEDITGLFRRFSRIARRETEKVSGTGLGLFIVKQVVERMGGRVWVKSGGRGKGSTFFFTLPKAAR